MKKQKFAKKSDYNEFEDFDDYDFKHTSKKKITNNQKRRPLRNIKKAWTQHESDFETVDEFFSK